MMAPKNKGVFPGDAGYSNLVYYVCPWNDEYCVYSSSHIQRHSNIKWVYNTKDKIVMETSKYAKGDKLNLTIPKSCIFNVGIGWKKDSDGKQKYICGDTDDYANWDRFSIPLPEGDWEIVNRSEEYNEITIMKK